MGNSTMQILAPHTVRRSRRYAVKNEQHRLSDLIMEKYDTSHSNSLNQAEVMEMCKSLIDEVAPKITITDADIDMIMRVGGDTAKPEIFAKDIPAALSTVMALKSENLSLHELFKKYDTDQSGNLPKNQLRNLLQELNEGILPNNDDLDYIIQQCDVSGDGAIEEEEIKAAVIAWYCLTDESLPSSIEEAKAQGYSTEQIQEYELFVSSSKEAAEAKEDSGEGKAEEGKSEEGKEAK